MGGVSTSNDLKEFNINYVRGFKLINIVTDAVSYSSLHRCTHFVSPARNGTEASQLRTSQISSEQF